ncbi:hypothetical protein [Mycetocola reblochoni]|uniref:Uncharacterized protein n=1 Tax=Mycetocola reblochoni REB411 TaxID=1255698 RepID=A0A1R4IXU0_9MICO|nr:hypothetical protein [Mycetocola reblochoni]SJN24650.1 hypothetical protein FM119_04390 [Mycetocola reblochoni REB411]
MTITPEAASAAAQILAVLTLAVIFDPTLRGALSTRHQHASRANWRLSVFSLALITIAADFILTLSGTTTTGVWAFILVAANAGSLGYLLYEAFWSMRAHLAALPKPSPGNEDN